MGMTGGGFVYKRMKREFCCDSPAVPDHCFAFELAATGGAWLDAPEYFPAGSMKRFEPNFPGGVSSIDQTSAWRDDQ